MRARDSWWITIFVLLGTLLGCGREPDAVFADRYGVHYNGHPRIDAQLAIAFDEVRAYGESLCGAKHYQAIACASVDFVESLRCGDTEAQGCHPIPLQCLFSVVYRDPVWASSLAHEMLHYVWEVCAGFSGTDEKGVHNPAFLFAVEGINARIADRMWAEGMTRQ